MLKSASSVCEGHPDKICDQIADAIVDEYLRRDKTSQVDVRVLGSHGMIMIGGEVASAADFDISTLAKQVYHEIGYEDEVEVFVNIEPPTSERKQAPKGTNEPVIVSGYATSETRERLPLASVYAHAICRKIDELRKNDSRLAWLRPDGTAQVIMEDGKVRAVNILISHQTGIQETEIKSVLLDRVVSPVVGEQGISVRINPSGPFTIDGFRCRSGVSGRLHVTDTYGGIVPQGDRPFSGLDASRAERAGAYAARLLAKMAVDEGLVSAAIATIAYIPAQEAPFAVSVNGMGPKSKGVKMDLTSVLRQTVDLSLPSVVGALRLLEPRYQKSSVYGTFGKESAPWEMRYTGEV